MYVNGAKIMTEVVGEDENLFFWTDGSMSLGGWGYSDDNYESLYPDVSAYWGRMDDFRLWGRSLAETGIASATRKKFETNLGVGCKKGSKDRWTKVGKLAPLGCELACNEIPTCWAYEIRKNKQEKSLCFHYTERPSNGPELEGAQCSPALK